METGPARARVAVIGGGRNSEHEVSLASAASVRAALSIPRFDVVALTIGRGGEWMDDAGSVIPFSEAVATLGRCDVAVPVVHGVYGEDGTLAGLLELARVPYVGSGVRAGAIAMDKWATKLVAEAVGVATARGVVVTSADEPPLALLPVVVKPIAAGSSHGVTLVTAPQDLRGAIELALQFDDRVLVEEVVHGREIDLAVLARPDGRRIVAAPLEIVLGGGLFDSETKYDGSADFRVPAQLTPAEAARLERAAVAVFDALGCGGVARVDFFLTADGPVLNEVNTMPGMTDLSQVPRMFEAVGMSYARLLATLVDDALLTDAASDR